VKARADRSIRVTLAIWASVAFLAMWVGVALNLAGGGRLAGDAWSWLTSLSDVLRLVAWVVVLPVTIGLWAAASGVPPVVGGVVVVGLVAWTAVAWFGLARALQTGRRG